MAFGIQNLGVINQKQAPAIWESDFADFPTNFIAGRICIALDAGNAGIYIDGTAERFKIADGATNFLNGVTQVGLSTPTHRNIGLGGELTQNTIINNLGGFEFAYQGNNNVTIFKIDGAMAYDSLDQVIPATTTEGLAPITPNAIINFIIPGNGVFRVAAQSI